MLNFFISLLASVTHIKRNHPYDCHRGDYLGYNLRD